MFLHLFSIFSAHLDFKNAPQLQYLCLSLIVSFAVWLHKRLETRPRALLENEMKKRKEEEEEFEI